MTDLDRILGLLTGTPWPEDPYDLGAGLRGLVGRLPADVTVELRLPEPELLRGLAGAVAETVGRLVQESLTNVVRHARPTHAVAAVEVGALGGSVVVRVVDDGTAVGGGEPGWPVAGGGGWSVVATIPTMGVTNREATTRGTTAPGATAPDTTAPGAGAPDATVRLEEPL
ncbi:sensor histidine kinase [Streptomyces sp. NPDC088387]|uniref:sensor histidine kinase n=1 Tax=Streptomyces sp. NPDC088387 TaxID=3365859 RepID=UPI0037FFD0F3